MTKPKRKLTFVRHLVVAMFAAIALTGLVAPAAAGADYRVCYDRGYEDLRAKRITCTSAQRVYRRSLQVASDDGTARFKLFGLRWRCSAQNPPRVAFYTWTCTASGGKRAAKYRWKSGD